MDALPRPLLSVVIHDVSPANWEACQRVMDAVRAVADIPLTLLAVPRFHLQPSEQAFEERLTELRWQGHELALHGYSHLDAEATAQWRQLLRGPWRMEGDGEFADLCESAALLKILAGVRWFQRRQWPLYGFVAPSWRLSEGTWAALKRVPSLSYTTTLSSVYHLPEAAPVASDCLVYDTSTRWCRWMSVPRNAFVSAGWGDHPLVRFELHPHDADHKLVCRSWTRLLERQLEQREVLPLAQAMAKLRQAGRATLPELTPLDGLPRTEPSVHRVVVPFTRPVHEKPAMLADTSSSAIAIPVPSQDGAPHHP